MKLILSLSSVLIPGALLFAAEASPAPCCPVPETKPACCVPEKAAAAPAACCTEEKPAAPLTRRSLYQVQSAWTDDTGATVKLAAFRGRPVVLAMFFAQCEYACPVLVNDMQRLRALLPEAQRAETRFVLVTFDVARDTTAALHAYRARMNLDAGWTLLRGDDADVQELAMLLGVKYKQDARGQFSHSNLFTILNQDGEIVHQHAGLKGDVSEAAKATTLASK